MQNKTDPWDLYFFVYSWPVAKVVELKLKIVCACKMEKFFSYHYVNFLSLCEYIFVPLENIITLDYEQQQQKIKAPKLKKFWFNWYIEKNKWFYTSNIFRTIMKPNS